MFLKHLPSLLLVIFPLTVSPTRNCGSCDLTNCDLPRNCLSGLVKDNCDCCYVCGLCEGERCDHDSLTYQGYGSCGENLECRQRTDLDEEDPEEATCVCVYNYPLCGSDGITYDNICQFTETRYKNRNGLRAVSREPCESVPRIVDPPKNIRNVTGAQVALTCEAIGWPLPSISWHSSNGNQLPDYDEDKKISIQSANGPGLTETTSWLYFLGLSYAHRAQYTCRATNYLGMASESARVFVVRRT